MIAAAGWGAAANVIWSEARFCLLTTVNLNSVFWREKQHIAKFYTRTHRETASNFSSGLTEN